MGAKTEDGGLRMMEIRNVEFFGGEFSLSTATTNE